MRISDWSSDVCSSDLPAVEPGDGTQLPADAAGFFRDNRLMATPEITPHEAHLRQSQGAVLVDVREDHERELGIAEGARGIARAELEEDPTFHFDDHDTELMLICQSGGRSDLAAEVPQRLGYRNVVSVRGGTLRWTADGFPLTRPEDRKGVV